MKILGLRSLPGQLSYLVLGILLLVQLGAFYVYFIEVEKQYFEGQGEDRIRHMVTAMHALERASQLEQEMILNVASNEELIIYIDDVPIPASKVTEPLLLKQLGTLNQLAQREGRFTFLNELRPGRTLYSDEKAEYYGELVDDIGAGFHDLVLVGLPLQDGRWLYATMFDREVWFLSGLRDELLYWIPIFLLAVGLIVLSVRRLTQPLSLLADKATRFGRGEAFKPLPIKGADEIRQATQAFNTMAERLQRHVSDRQQLLAAISHDLRSPLTGMRIQAEFIEDKHIWRSVVAGVEEMQQMIESVLRFAREDAQDEQVIKVDIHQLLQLLTEEYQLQQQEVSFSWEDEQRIYVTNTRPLALKRVLRNLLENALKYGKRAKVKLFTRNKQLLIVITDSGPGIPEADMERVFEPFTQLDSSRQESRSGVGMGLSVARSLMRALGGDLRLENRHGAASGLRVTIYLPL